METLEELKAIIDGASDGDLFFCDNQYLDHRLNVRKNHAKYTVRGVTYNFNYQQPTFVAMDKLRSLSDIKRIIELMEQVKSGYEAYARVEAVKQRYNGENKRKTNILIGAEKLLRGCNTPYCHYLTGTIKGALK